MRLINITKLVKRILEEDPKTRCDDYLLWLRVIQCTQVYNIPDTLNMSVYEFLQRAKFMRIVPFISVARARRKMQELYPELRASAETQAARSELEEQYREYARTNV